MDSMEKFRGAVLLKDRAYEVLKHEIMVGNFKPGDRLNISELASKMNISYAPIREALNLLCKEGLVELPPHKHAVVAAANETDLKITTQLRMLLEPFAAELSTNLVPDEKLSELRQELQMVLDDPADESAYFQSDMELHEMIHIYVGSKMLSDTLESLKVSNMRYRYMNEYANPEQRLETIRRITREHLDILDAFEARDPVRIKAMVETHIACYRERCEEAWKLRQKD